MVAIFNLIKLFYDDSFLIINSVNQIKVNSDD